MFKIRVNSIYNGYPENPFVNDADLQSLGVNDVLGLFTLREEEYECYIASKWALTLLLLKLH